MSMLSLMWPAPARNRIARAGTPLVVIVLGAGQVLDRELRLDRVQAGVGRTNLGHRTGNVCRGRGRAGECPIRPVRRADLVVPGDIRLDPAVDRGTLTAA